MKDQTEDVLVGTQMFEIDENFRIVSITQIDKKEGANHNEKITNIIKNSN